MSTLKEIIYNIQNLPGKGKKTDDVKLSNRQLEFIINHARTEIAAQRVNSKKSLEGFWQELNNLKISATRDFRPYNSDVTILKSIIKLPSIATGHEYGHLIDFIGFRDAVMSMQKSTVNTFNLDIENPYIKSLFFIVDDYLYIVTRDSRLSKEVYVRAVFESPKTCVEIEGNLDPFDEFNWEYPIPTGLIGQLNNIVVNSEFKWINIFPQDLKNDSQDAQQ